MNVRSFLLCTVIVSTICSAEQQDSTRWNFSGWGFFTFGRIESSIKEVGQANRDYNFNKEMLVDFDAGLKTVVTLGRSSKARLHLGLTTAYMIGDDLSPNSAEFLKRRAVPYLIDAAIEKTMTSESGAHEFFGEFGFFPVKYNPEARNLGEYLFRSGTYYPFINSGFELADKEKLTGLHGKYTNKFSEKSNLKADLYFTSDMRDFPIHDFSLSYILSANFAKIFEISAGAMHAHFISMDERKTTPYYDDTLFPKYDGKRIYDVAYPTDSSLGIYDTVIYTFRGTKAVARLAFDPKRLFGDVDGQGFLGKEDLKLYSEAAILGIQNYPVWYEKRADRMPIMFGINWFTNQFASYCVIPGVMANRLEPINANKIQRTIQFGTAGIIAGVGTWLLDHFLKTNTRADLISIEVEHNPSPYMNTAETAWKNRSPLPYTPGLVIKDLSIADKPARITDDDWKWSVYISKKVGHFKFSGQIASDHMIRSPYMLGPPTSIKYTEICPRSKDWYWMLRVMYMF